MKFCKYKGRRKRKEGGCASRMMEIETILESQGKKRNWFCQQKPPVWNEGKKEGK